MGNKPSTIPTFKMWLQTRGQTIGGMDSVVTQGLVPMLGSTDINDVETLLWALRHQDFMIWRAAASLWKLYETTVLNKPGNS